MDTLLYAGLGNAVAATALALVVAAVAHFCRRPALVHSLWLLVLLKLLTPPLLPVPLPWPARPGPVPVPALDRAVVPRGELPAGPAPSPAPGAERGVVR